MGNFDWVAGLSGLLLGSLIATVVLYINYRIGKKQRRFDERYEQIHNKGRSIAWVATVFAILVGWGVVIVMEGASLAFFIITFIYIVSMISYIIGAAYASNRM